MESILFLSFPILVQANFEIDWAKHGPRPGVVRAAQLSCISVEAAGYDSVHFASPELPLGR